LAEATAKAGNPAIPLVAALTSHVAQGDAPAARYVHWGATSQDAMDTGLVLQLRQVAAVLREDLDRLSAALAGRAEEHKTTLLSGRTLLQHATPVTLGVKMAGWLDAVERHAARLEEVLSRTLVLQLGGAAGTLAALGGNGRPRTGRDAALGHGAGARARARRVARRVGDPARAVRARGGGVAPDGGDDRRAGGRSGADACQSRGDARTDPRGSGVDGPSR